MARQGKDCMYYYNPKLTCFKGDRCIFRHCDAALGSEMVCDDWLNEICFIDDCPYRHITPQTTQPQTTNMLCYYDMQPGGCRNPNCRYLHNKQIHQPGGLNQPPAPSGFTSLVEIPLVSDVPADAPTSDIPPDQMSMSFEEPYAIPSVIVSHRLSGDPDLPQVEPIIINPMDDESSDPESTQSLSPGKNSSKPGSLENIPEENEKDLAEKGTTAEVQERVVVKQKELDSEGEKEEEEEESEEEEEEESEEAEESEEEVPVIELFDTEGAEVLGEIEEKPVDRKKDVKNGKEAKKSEEAADKKAKEDTDLTEVLSLEEVMRRKALESMYKRRAEKEKAKQNEGKSKEDGKNKDKEDGKKKKEDKKEDKKRSRKSHSRSPSPYRRGRSPDSRGWRGWRRGPIGRDGRRSPPYGRRSPPFGGRSPPRRHSPFRRHDRRDPVHRMAVARLRGKRFQAEKDLDDLAIEARKLEERIRSSEENVKVLKQVELKKRKELLRKQLEMVNQELEEEGDDTSSSSSGSSSCSSSSESESSTESGTGKKKVTVIASKIQRREPHRHTHDKHIASRQGITLDEIRRKRALKTAPLDSAHADSDGSGKKVRELSLAEIRRRRAEKFALVKPVQVSGSGEIVRPKPTKVQRMESSSSSSSSSEQSSDEEVQQEIESPDLVILKKIEPLRKINIRKVASQGAKNSSESLESQAQRELGDKNALRKIQVQRIIQDSSAETKPVQTVDDLDELEQTRQTLLEKLKDESGEVAEKSDEVPEDRKSPVVEEARIKPRVSTRRVLVVGKEEPKKETSVKKAATDIVIKSLEDIKREKETENSQRRKANLPRNKSETNLLKRGASNSEEDNESKRRLIRRNAQQIYVPPVAVRLRETKKEDEPTPNVVRGPKSKVEEPTTTKADAPKIPVSRLKDTKSSGEIVVKTFSEIMKEKRERKQKELEEKRLAAAAKTDEKPSAPKTVLLSPIVFEADVQKSKLRVSVSDTTMPKRKLYSEPEKPAESRMLTNWGARRSKPLNKVESNKAPRTSVLPQKSVSESARSNKTAAMEIVDWLPEDDDLDLGEVPVKPRSDEEQEAKSRPVTKPAAAALKSDGSGDTMEISLGPKKTEPKSTKSVSKSIEPAVMGSKRKTSSEEKSKVNHRTSTSDALMDEFDLLLEEGGDDIGSQDNEVQVQDDDALLMELEEMLA